MITSTRMMAAMACAALLVAGCSAPVKRNVRAALGQWKNTAPTAPKWDYLTTFRSKITLPSLVVGERGELSSGCLQLVEPQLSKASDQMALGYREAAQTSARLVSSLEATLKEVVKGKSNFDAEALSQAADQWKVEIQDLEWDRADPDHADNFLAPLRTEAGDLGRMTVPALQWFVKDRAMVVDALRAKKAKLTRTTGISESLKAALKLAVKETTDTAKGNLALQLADLVEQGGQISIQANDTFFAVRSTAIATRVCKVPAAGAPLMAVEPGRWYTLCGYFRFKFELLGEGTGQVRYKVERPGSDTVEYLERIDSRTMRPLDGVHLVGPRVSRDGGGYLLDFYGFLVGPRG